MAFNGVDFASVSRQLDEAHAASRERTMPQPPPPPQPMPVPYMMTPQQPRPSEVLLRRALALQDAPAGSTGAKVVTAGKMALGGASLGLVVLGALWVSRRITKAKGGVAKDEALLAWDMDTIVPVVIAFVIGAGFTWLAKKLRQDKEQEHALELLRVSGQMMPTQPQALPQVPAQTANDQLIRETLESAGISPNAYSALPVAT